MFVCIWLWRGSQLRNVPFIISKACASLAKLLVNFIKITSKKGFISQEVNWWEAQGETNYLTTISEKPFLSIKCSFFYFLRLFSLVKVVTSTLSAEQRFMQTTSVGLCCRLLKYLYLGYVSVHLHCGLCLIFFLIVGGDIVLCCWFVDSHCSLWRIQREACHTSIFTLCHFAEILPSPGV
jgi:hypothetical protein